MKISINTVLPIMFLAFVTSFAHAQKIKVKKEIVFVDGKEIPIRVTNESKSGLGFGDYYQTLTFSDTATSTVFAIVENRGVMLSPKGYKATWIDVYDAKKEKSNSADFNPGFGSGANKVVLRLMREYQFFNSKGVVSPEKIADFFELTTWSKDKRKAAKMLMSGKQSDSLLNQVRPFVKRDLTTIVKGGALGSEAVGRVVAPNRSGNSQLFSVRVYDLDNKLIATARSDVFGPVKVSLDNKTSFEYEALGRLPTQEFLTELTEQMVRRGYFSEGGYNEELAQLMKEEAEETRIQEQKMDEVFEERLSNANYLFERPGYLMTKKGEKIEGPITMFFERVVHPNKELRHTINGLNHARGNGSVLSTKVLGRSDELVDKRYSVKHLESFVIFDEDGKEIIYKPVAVRKLARGYIFRPLIESYGDVDIFKSPTDNLIIHRGDEKYSYLMEYEIPPKPAKKKAKAGAELKTLYGYLCDNRKIKLRMYDKNDNGLATLLANQESGGKLEVVKENIDLFKACLRGS